MPRVAHVLRKLDATAWGGTETHVTEIARRLPALGWESEIHAPAGPEHDGTSVPVRRFRAFAPFIGSSVQRAALWDNAGNLATLDEPLKLVRDRELALAHLHTAGRIGGAVRSAMRWTGRPYVISIHGPRFAECELLTADTERRLDGLVDLGQPIGALFGARRVFHDASRVLCFNRQERDAAAELVGERAICMDHGVDRERFSRGNLARARTRWPELGAAPVLTVVGRVCEQKNQRLAVAAFAAGAPVTARLVLAGAPTDRGYLESVLALARELGVSERVHVLGNLAPRDIPDLLARTQLVVTPSQHEAFGLVVLEAWAAMRPVIFTRRAGLADLADALGGDAPAIESFEVDAWAAAIRTRLASPERRAAEARAGAALVLRRYSWERVTERLGAIYAEVLAERGTRAAA
jgi:D-inositol-3-phosphate glycosyltransferase